MVFDFVAGLRTHFGAKACTVVALSTYPYALRAVPVYMDVVCTSYGCHFRLAVSTEGPTS